MEKLKITINVVVVTTVIGLALSYLSQLFTIVPDINEYREAHDGPLCPDCGAVTQRVYSMATPIFKGSGFYSTDNK